MLPPSREVFSVSSGLTDIKERKCFWERDSEEGKKKWKEKTAGFKPKEKARVMPKQEAKTNVHPHSLNRSRLNTQASDSSQPPFLHPSPQASAPHLPRYYSHTHPRNPAPSQDSS